jgi:hypothetical protein
MITRTILKFIFLVSTALLISSCTTEVDLNAPYKSTPVIVSVLNYTADTQFVRINRTYLSNDNATIYAQVRDSVQYDPSEVEAWLFKKRNGIKIDSILLEPIIKPSREPGAFFDTDITFWYTTSPLFTEAEIDDIYTINTTEMTYALEVEARGENYYAETGFPRIKNSSINYPQPTVNGEPGAFKLIFYRTTTANRYQNISFQYKALQPTARYQGVLRLNCDFVKSDGSVLENQVIDYQLGVTEHELTDPDGTNRYSFNTENWYAFVGNVVRQIPNIETVRMSTLEFMLTGANNDLNAYINVAQPISDFTPVLTVYSNFNNGAIGILGSKTIAVSSFYIDDPSVENLNTGEYAYGVSYCTKAPWPGSSYPCQ